MSADSLLKYLAIIFLFSVMMGCLCIVGVQILNGGTPSAYAITILGSGLGYAMTAAGVTHGSSIVSSVTGASIASLLQQKEGEQQK